MNKHRFGLTLKITSLLLGLMAVAAINLIVISDYLAAQKNDALIVNVAGRQRMLSQKMSRLALSVARGSAEDRAKLEETIDLYDASLKVLQFGGEAMGQQIPPSPQEMDDLFRKNKERWMLFRKEISLLVQSDPGSTAHEKALSYINAKNEALLELCQKLVSIYNAPGVFTRYANETGIAGKLMVLTQKIPKYALLVERGEEKKALHFLSASVNEFDSLLELLRDGGSLPGGRTNIEAAPPAVHRVITVIEKEWKVFRKMSLLMAGTPGETSSYMQAVDYVRLNNDKLLQISDEVTKKFEAISVRKVTQLRNMLWLMLGINVVIFIVGYYLSKRMVKPLRSLAGLAADVGAGKLSVKVENLGHDEIGDLGYSFNNMIENLKASHDSLMSAKSFTEDILKSMIDPLLVISFDGIIKDVNTATLKLLEYSPHELEGKPLNLILPGSHKMLGQAASGEEMGVFRTRLGEEIPVSLHISLLKKEKGEFIGYVCVARDMRDINELIEDLEHTKWELQKWSKTLEDKVDERTQELRQANEVIIKVMEELRTEKEKAECASEAKSMFLANMSHEIRTPLTAIIGFSEILQGTALDEDQLDYVQTVYESAQILLETINDILDISKIEANQLQLELVEFGLAELLEGVMEIFRPQHLAKNISLELHLHSSLDNHYKGDPTRIRHILTNLLSNALKFTEEGRVILQVNPDDNEEKTKVTGKGTNKVDAIRFSVIDTGIGIPDDKQEIIFDTFTQADMSTTRRFGGTGLGLHIVKKLAELMGSSIELTSCEGEGSEFSFVLNLEESQADETRVKGPE